MVCDYLDFQKEAMKELYDKLVPGVVSLKGSHT